MRKEKIYNVPNFFTLLRIIILAFMWVLFFKEQKITIGIFLGLALITDFFDGFFARKLNQRTKFGAKFDAIADNMVSASIIIWMPFLLREMLTKNIMIISITISLAVISWLIATIKYKRNPEFHLISDKISMAVVGTFIVHALIFGYNQIFLYIAVAVQIYTAIEEIVITITHKEIDENISSIFQELK